MKTKYLDIVSTWDCRKAGGLFLGVAVELPTSMISDEYLLLYNSSRYEDLRFTFGFLLFSIGIHIKYNYKKALI